MTDTTMDALHIDSNKYAQPDNMVFIDDNGSWELVTIDDADTNRISLAWWSNWSRY